MGIFTGLIVEIGEVLRVDRGSDGVRVQIGARLVLEGTRIGDSISINGVDLTVVTMDSKGFTADVSLETLKRSTFGELRPGSLVNLERALELGERFGGHMVQGHVDGVGRLLSILPEGNGYRLRVEFPPELSRYIAMKGSITVDGISLTVAELGEDWLELAIIPHTWNNTTVRSYHPGTKVNLEVDVLAKYVERLLGDRAATQAGGRLTVEHLIEQGY
jgi:riboflavin synthase